MAQQVVTSFKYLKYTVGTAFLGQFLYTKYIDTTLYSNVYEYLISKFNPNSINEIHKKLLSMNYFKKINNQKYEEHLNGKLNNIYLPNIIGLASGYDSQGNCVENLFDLGFGFIEIGSLNPQIDVDSELQDENQLIPSEGVVEYMNDIKNQSVLKAKAYLGTFKNNINNNMQNLYPIGSNIVPNRETKMFNPYLSDVDYIQAAQEMLSVSDYVVLNLQGPEIKGIKHLLTVEKLTEIIKEIKKERVQEYALQAIFEYEENEIQEKYEGKILKNKIYTSEVFGRKPVNNKLINPQIYLKLSCQQNQQLIMDIANKYQEIGVEGLVLVDNNTSNATQNLRKVKQISNGQLPLISVGGIRNPKDVIERVKNGANAVQICSEVYLKGPNYVEKFLQDTLQELKNNNVDAIKQLQNIDIE